MAELLGRIHAEAFRLRLGGQAWFPPLRRFDWSSNPWWDLGVINDQMGADPTVQAILAELDALPKLLVSLDGLPECLIHNDFHRGNLIANDKTIVGVVDWDWATIDWRALDVAAGMRCWMLHPDTPGLEAAVDFVDRYEHDAGRLSRAERHALPDILYLRSLWTCLYDLGRAVDCRLDGSGLVYRFDVHNQLRSALPLLSHSLKLSQPSP